MGCGQASGCDDNSRKKKGTNVKVGITDHSQEEVLLIPFRFTNIWSGLSPGHSKMKQTWLLPGATLCASGSDRHRAVTAM